MEKVMEDALSELKPLIEERKAFVEVAEFPSMEGNSYQMRQLFQNLVANAIKYSKEGESPLIRITSELADGECLIRVEDSGIGFDERYLDKIFRPCQRLHGKDSAYKGTGMGLAICRKVVEMHGGAITARSEPGRGATFIIRIPVEQRRGGH